MSFTNADNLAFDQGLQTGHQRKRPPMALLGRLRLQLPLALFCGVLVPALAGAQWDPLPTHLASHGATLPGTIAAILIGLLVFRKVTTLPGTSALTNVLPAFLTSYSIVAVAFFALRLDYSRGQFLVSFVLTSLLFGAFALALSRAHRLHFALVPGGRAERLKSVKALQWTQLETPEAAERVRDCPIVADLRNPDLGDDWQRYLAEEAISGRRVYEARHLRESLQGRVQVGHLAENEFGHLAPDSIYAPSKRYFDAVFALLILIAVLPIGLAIALLIRLESRGPALFRQERVGYRGKVFTLYKFRSMKVATEAANDLEADMTRSDDDRITRIGGFLRKTRLDELPQLINILRGEMSWIGPRPETVKLSRWYEREIAFYRYRHIVRPGISGWAQVNQGHVTTVDDVRAKLEYDFYYVKHFSLWLDLLILLKTLNVVLTGRGAR